MNAPRFHRGGVEGWGAAFLALLLLPTLFFPIHRDLATFALGGQIVSEGGTLYRDFWDNKPPAIYGFYALPALLFPSQAAGIYAFNLLATGVAAGCLAGLARRLGHAEAGLAAAAWLVVLQFEAGFVGLGQAETVANAPLLCAALGCAARPGWKGALLIGILAGIVVLFKPTSLLPLLPFLCLLPRNGKTFAALGAGGLFTLLGAAWWLHATGGWEAYLDIQREFVVPYVRHSKQPFLDHVQSLGLLGVFWALTLWLPTLLMILALFNRDKTSRPLRIYALAAFGCGFLALWGQNRAFPYQWQPMLPAFALLAASGSAWLGQKTRLSTPKIALLALAAPLVWMGVRHFDTHRQLVRWKIMGGSEQDYLASFNWFARGKTLTPNEAVLPAARFVRLHSKPHDRLWVWGFEPGIYLEAGRRPPNRFFHHLPLVASYAPSKWRDEAWNSLQKAPPRFIVLITGDSSHWMGAPAGDSATLWRQSAIYPWFKRHYGSPVRRGRFLIYRYGENSR